jgi:hypothetical protein
MAQNSLALLHEVIVSGGAVTTMSTGTITALEEGVVYKIQVGISNVSGGNAFRCHINGDTTTGNYRNGLLTSQQGAGYSNAEEGPSSWNDMCTGDGYIFIEDGQPSVSLNMCQQDGTGSQFYGRMNWVYNANESTITEVSFEASTALKIDNGSFIRIWKAVQSTL